MKFYTYIHTRADDLKVFYVGKGTARDNRAHSRKGRSPFWHRTVAKHGVRVDVCMRFQDEAAAFEHERFLIACFRDLGAPLANLTDGGEGPAGFTHSVETRKKLSVAGKGRKRTPEQIEATAAANRGKKRPPDVVTKIVAANAGFKHSAETKEKIRLIRTGATTSAEIRAKQSAALKGVPKTPEHVANALASRMANGGRKRGPEAALKAWATKRAKAAAKALLCQE